MSDDIRKRLNAARAVVRYYRKSRPVVRGPRSNHSEKLAHALQKVDKLENLRAKLKNVSVEESKKCGIRPYDDSQHIKEIWRGAEFSNLKDNIYFRRLPFRKTFRRHYFLKLKCSCCGCIVFRDRSNYTRHKNEIKTNRDTHCGNKACETSIRSGSNNVRWSGGRKRKRGRKYTKSHILVHMPSHPYAKKGWIPEHRAVVEKNIGRTLEPTEIVHHIDCDPENNTIGNLQVCKSNTEHFLIHGSLNVCVKPLMEAGVLKFDEVNKRYFCDGLGETA